MHLPTTFLSTLLLATSVTAHGRLVKPPGLPNTTGLQNIRVPANGCGDTVRVSAGNVVATWTTGTTQEVTWNINNGDGGGPLGVFFDATGQGTRFTPATMVKNLGGQNGGIPNGFPRGDHVISFKVPTTKCDRCVVQVRQVITGNNGFGSCAIVRIV